MQVYKRKEELGAYMTMCKFSALALAVALCACASAPPAEMPAMIQNAVFVAGDAAAPVKPANVADTKAADGMAAEPTKADQSTLRRLYWILSGR